MTSLWNSTISDWALNSGYRFSAETLVPLSKAPKTRFQPDDAPTDQVSAVIGAYDNGVRGLIFNSDIFRQSENEAAREQARSNGFNVPWSAEKRQERAKEITGLQVTDAFEQELLIETGSLEQVMGVMQQCIDDLLISKGLDPKIIATLSREPMPRQQIIWAMRTQEAYPTDLVRKRLSGKVDLRVLVDENGKVIDCATNPAGEDPRFDIAACESAFKYAKFDAARDMNGMPTKGFFSTTVIYSL